MVTFYNHIKILWRQSFLDHINTLFETLKSLSFSPKTSYSPCTLLTIALSFIYLPKYCICMYVHIGIIMYGEDSEVYLPLFILHLPIVWSM